FMNGFFFHTSNPRYALSTGPHLLTPCSRSILPGPIESHRNCFARSGTFVYFMIAREPNVTGWMSPLGPLGYVQCPVFPRNVALFTSSHSEPVTGLRINKAFP